MVGQRTVVNAVKRAAVFLDSFLFQTICLKRHVAGRRALCEALAVSRVQQLVDPARSHFLAQPYEEGWRYDAHVLFVVHLEVQRRIVKRDRGLSVSSRDPVHG